MQTLQFLAEAGQRRVCLCIKVAAYIQNRPCYSGNPKGLLLFADVSVTILRNTVTLI